MRFYLQMTMTVAKYRLLLKKATKRQKAHPDLLLPKVNKRTYWSNNAYQKLWNAIYNVWNAWRDKNTPKKRYIDHGRRVRLRTAQLRREAKRRAAQKAMWEAQQAAHDAMLQELHPQWYGLASATNDPLAGDIIEAETAIETLPDMSADLEMPIDPLAPPTDIPEAFVPIDPLSTGAPEALPF